VGLQGEGSHAPVVLLSVFKINQSKSAISIQANRLFIYASARNVSPRDGASDTACIWIGSVNACKTIITNAIRKLITVFDTNNLGDALKRHVRALRK
jgi:hypothetical protein